MTNFVIIPCMGQSARFAAEGYDGPKALLPVRRARRVKPMIEWIVESFPNDWTPLIVAHQDHWRKFVKATGGGAVVKVLESQTRGQSDTILRALSSSGMFSGENCPVAVQNCDLLLDYDTTSSVLSADDDMVVLHRDDGTDPVFSYVNSAVRARVFVEKVRISPWAMTGLWRFRSSPELTMALGSQILGGHPHRNGEYYLSTALNSLKGGMKGRIVDKWTDWGTPAAVHRSGCELA